MRTGEAAPALFLLGGWLAGSSPGTSTWLAGGGIRLPSLIGAFRGVRPRPGVRHSLACVSLVGRWLGVTLLFAAAAFATEAGRAAEPIKIGLGMALSGQLAANGKAALVGMKIWEEDVNGKGGLLGRPVKLVYYDDQSNPSNVPGIYTKLLDIDKVDLIVAVMRRT